MKQIKHKLESILNIRSWALSCLYVYAVYLLYCFNDILSLYIINGSIEPIEEKPEPTLVYQIAFNFSTLIESNALLNILSLVGILLTTGTTLYKVVKESHKAKFYTLCFLIFLFATLCSHPMWEYATIPFLHTTYDVVLAVVVFVGIITIIITNAIDAFKPKSTIVKQEATSVGLSVNDSADHQDLGWAEYMNTLLAKIKSTDISKEAFTVGISGQWGSGKTTFLQELENQLRASNYIIVKFNPWNCHSAQQVITSFFCALVSAMNVKKDSIGDALTEYGNLLADLNVHPLLSKFLRHKEKDIDVLKNQLQEQMVNCGRKISILIDDIDRLDQNEVYETLRLIRETANFPNIVYFVAYDSRHVINMLAEKGISNGNEYIRKIFQMEIPLPSYESYILPMVLLKELKRHISNKEDFHMVQFVASRTTQTGEYLLTHYLKNFRDVKRFVNSFIISYTHITTKLEKTEYSITDLMWLELLHYSDLETYQKLYTAPLTFLTSYTTEKGPVYNLRNEYSHSGAYVVSPKKDKTETDTPLAKYIKSDDPFIIHEDTATLLSMLFGLSIHEDATIKYIENYNKYFAYRLPKNNIGTTEFRKVLLSSNSSDEIETSITEWLTGFASKRQSLLRQMQQFEVSTQTIQVCKNYLSVVLYLIRTSSPGTIDKFCRICLDKKKYPDAIAEELSNWFYQKLVEILPTLQYPWTWVYICKNLYPITTWREDGEGNQIEEYEPLTLLSSVQLQKLSSINFVHYMDWVGHPSIIELTKRHSNLNSFVKENIVPTAYNPEYDETNSKNLILDDLQKYYSVNKSVLFSEFIRPLTPDVQCGYYQEELEDIQNTISKMFESPQGFKHFIESCFVESDEIQKYYKQIGIAEI